MQKNTRFIALIVCDFIILISSIIGLLFSALDVRFMVDVERLSSLPILMTFTGLSNLFIGLVCLGCAVYRLRRKDVHISRPLFLLKLISLSEITITLVITAAVLAPQLGSSWWRLYINNNLFNHFITPLLALIAFIVFEPYTEISFSSCFFALIPIVLYGIFYVLDIVTQLNEDGSINSVYDIYGLLKFGIPIGVLFFVGFLGASFGLTVLYRFIKQKNHL